MRWTRVSAAASATLAASTFAFAPTPTSPVVDPGATAPASGRVLRVGPTGEFQVPSAAAAVAHDGDVVEIAPGDYRGDVAIWSANRLRITGGQPRPHLMAGGRDADGKGIWVIRGDDVVVENVEMSGARVRDRNGAAIRAEGRRLTLRGSYVHDNENGLLAGAIPGGEITIERCEFARNGGGEGQTHNLYVGAIAKLVVKQSYFHHALVGHNLKSRALVSIVTDSRFADEADGRASYEAEFPNGGQVTLAFNIFQKGPQAENATVLSFGAEGLAPGVAHELVARGNTFISQRPQGVRFFAAPPEARAVFDGNVFAGRGALPEVPGIRANNAVSKDMPGNVNLLPEGFR